MKFSAWLKQLIPTNSITNTSTFAAPSQDLIQALMGVPASAGKIVTRATAIRVAAVLSSIKTLSNDIAKMPLVTYETGIIEGRQRTKPALDNPLYPLFRYVPNRWQTSFQLRWFLASQLISNGNCFCQIIRNQKGEVIELVPLNAWQMAVGWDYSGGRTPKRDSSGQIIPVLVWTYSDGASQDRKFYQEDLWHVTAHNLEGTGFEGSSLYALGKEAISMLIAAEEVAGRNFASGLGMSGFISFPADGGPDEAQAQNIVDRLKKDFAGSANAGKFTIIPSGGKWEKMSYNAEESQLLDSRKWNEETIARMFGGAPLVVKLGLGQQNSTYASSSAFLDEYFNTALLPYTSAIEQSISRDLIAPEDRAKVYVKHNADVILRGSPRERAETNKILIESGQLMLNEARAIEDRDWVEGGDVLSLSANSSIFDVAEQEWFIPGQQTPEAEEGETPDPAMPENEPDAAGSGSGAAAPVPQKTKARLNAIANSLAERVMRKAAKSDLDAKFVAEVLACSLSDAEKFCEQYKNLKPEEARAALVALATGE